MLDRPILALCTPRTGPRFVHEACGVPHALRWIIAGDLSEEALLKKAKQVAQWGRENPTGAVVSLGDDPSLVHALAGQMEPSIRSLRGASLRATLASFDKGYCRQVITGDLGRLQTAVLRKGDKRVPWLAESTPQPVMVKPVGGCASVGIVQTETGAPAPPISNVSAVLSKLCAQHLPHNPALDDVVAVVEEYVPPSVSRVSVDGWVDESGAAVPFAISDNRYIEGEPERFCHQQFPSRVSPQGQRACWALYEKVVERLASSFGLRSQFCDVEMFVYEHEAVPRAEVMEVNCRVHPNITPILRVCLDGADVFGAHLSSPSPPTKRAGERAAGALYYLWSSRGEQGAPDPQLVRQWESQADVLACIFDHAGPQSNGMTCWGWLYVFGPDPESVRALGERVRDAIMD